MSNKRLVWKRKSMERWDDGCQMEGRKRKKRKWDRTWNTRQKDKKNESKGRKHRFQDDFFHPSIFGLDHFPFQSLVHFYHPFVSVLFRTDSKLVMKEGWREGVIEWRKYRVKEHLSCRQRMRGANYYGSMDTRFTHGMETNERMRANLRESTNAFEWRQCQA